MTSAAPHVGARVVGLFVGHPRRMAGASVASVDGDLAAGADDGGGSATSPTWISGFVKSPCGVPLVLGATNLDGDAQADLRVHGGPDKAVCVYPERHYDAWRADLAWTAEPPPEGSRPFGPGAFGENVTLGGLDEGGVCIGDTFRLGTATVQVSQPREPCWKVGRRWGHPELTHLLRETGRTGWYLRVLEPGVVAPDAAVALLDRPHPEWTVADANRVRHHDRDDLDGAARLAALPELSVWWSVPLHERVARRG